MYIYMYIYIYALFMLSLYVKSKEFTIMPAFVHALTNLENAASLTGASELTVD